MTDPRVDAYMAEAADFAKPILEYWRVIVHDALPDCEETIKWGTPHFALAGTICGMAAFKEHCAFFFSKSPLLEDPKGLLNTEAGGGWGTLGKIKTINELPNKTQLKKWLKQAAKLNADGVKVSAKKVAAPSASEIPPELSAALSLKKNAKAKATFDDFPPGAKREYCVWIADAKRDATKEKRVAEAIEWLAEGKKRNWKYENC